MIDGGEPEQNILIPYLLARKIKTIDYLIISHFDSDHVGGLLEVMENLKVKNVIISKQKEISENFKTFKQIVKKKKINVIYISGKSKNIQKIPIEKNLYFDFLWPNSEKLILENPLNNNSIVCKLIYNNFSMLFTGDIEEIAEKQILQEYKNNLEILKSTILKVAHHGSNTSSIKDFINAVQPKIALIGVGKNNKFGHPNDEVISEFESQKVKIFRTDKCGEIDLIVDNNKNIRIKTVINES